MIGSKLSDKLIVIVQAEIDRRCSGVRIRCYPKP